MPPAEAAAPSYALQFLEALEAASGPKPRGAVAMAVEDPCVSADWIRGVGAYASEIKKDGSFRFRLSPWWRGEDLNL